MLGLNDVARGEKTATLEKSSCHASGALGKFPTELCANKMAIDGEPGPYPVPGRSFRGAGLLLGVIGVSLTRAFDAAILPS